MQPRIARLWKLSSALGAAAALVCGCTHALAPRQSATPASASRATSEEVALTGAGATFPYPLYSKWFDVYDEETGVKINYQSIGSGGGIQQLKAKTVDFGASDAPLSDAELAEMPAPVLHIPTVAGAVAVAFNLSHVEVLRLDADALARIFLGEIKQWDDARLAAINPGQKLPSMPIAVVHRSDGSGTSYIFTTYLSAVSPAWKSKVGAGKAVHWPAGIGGKGNEGVAGIIKQTPGAIGYVELAYALDNKLPVASLKNSAGNFVAPTVEATTAAAAGAVQDMKKDIRASIMNSPGEDAYPIAGFTYILVYQSQQDSAKGAALVDFLNWAVDEGEKYAADLHYAPLPEQVVALDREIIATIETTSPSDKP